MRYIVYTGESMKKQITDPISKNLIDSDLESIGYSQILHGKNKYWEIYLTVLFFWRGQRGRVSRAAFWPSLDLAQTTLIPSIHPEHPLKNGNFTASMQWFWKKTQ